MQNIARSCQQTFENKNVVDITQQCFALLPHSDAASWWAGWALAQPGIRGFS